MRAREYQYEDRLPLVEILKRNIPKYFSEKEISEFEEYLDKEQWDYHHVYLNSEGRVVGCAGFYLKSPGVVGLTWAFFEPGQLGGALARKELERYLSIAAHHICPNGNAMLLLNTTPRVAKLMQRFGFTVTSVEEDGYESGYDRVGMEKRLG